MGRSAAAEVFKLRGEIDDAQGSVEALKRENSSLQNEISDLSSSGGDSAKNNAEFQKMRRRLEMEKEELQTALEDAEQALEAEAAKTLRARMEVSAVSEDINRRLAEKDDEFDAARKAHQRAVENIQTSLEAEARGRSEAARQKKKLEADISDLEIALDSANRGRAEAEKNTKKYQGQAREVQLQLEEEQRAREGVRDQFMASERRSNVLAGEIQELRTQLDSAHRAHKRTLMSDIQAMQRELEDQASALVASDEHAKRALADASHMAEQLRQEQSTTAHVDKARRMMESQ